MDVCPGSGFIRLHCWLGSLASCATSETLAGPAPSPAALRGLNLQPPLEPILRSSPVPPMSCNSHALCSQEEGDWCSRLGLAPPSHLILTSHWSSLDQICNQGDHTHSKRL